MTMQKREVSYTWRLRGTMAEHGMYATTDLVEPLRERGIHLSVSQVHRLVTGTPERLSLKVLSALCDIFATEPGELVSTRAANIGIRKTATDDAPAPPNVAELRPKRARITPAE